MLRDLASGKPAVVSQRKPSAAERDVVANGTHPVRYQQRIECKLYRLCRRYIQTS
jgi:hypothetical protein